MNGLSGITNMEKVYSKFSKKDLILRDHLAIDRTILANESTFLAYLRTGLSLVAGGTVILKFFEFEFSIYIAIFLGLLGVLTLIQGYIRFIKMKSSIENIRGDENNE